ncbi:ABC transporter permease [Embleya sp. NPDC055610]
MLVGVFPIGNTSSTLIAARTRQSGLLRAVGARRGQVNRLVLGEAGVLGVAGSTLGLALGVALAVGLIRPVGPVGDAPAVGGPTVRPGTPVVVHAVGVLITLAAAWLPARRAGRVPPMTARPAAGGRPGRCAVAASPNGARRCGGCPRRGCAAARGPGRRTRRRRGAARGRRTAAGSRVSVCWSCPSTSKGATRSSC